LQAETDVSHIIIIVIIIFDLILAQINKKCEARNQKTGAFAPASILIIIYF